MSEFKNMNVAILNATGAIAQGIAGRFAEQGAHIAAIDASAELARHAAAFDAMGPGAVHKIPFNADPKALIAACESATGPLDVLICAAPPVGQVTVFDMSAEDLRRTVEMELCVPALLMQEAGRQMAERGKGRIVSLFSMSAKTGVHTKVAPFAAAKGGLLAYSRVMAAELAPTGVTVNGVATALFEPQAAVLEEEERQALAKAIPVRRFGRVSEAARAVEFLCSREAAFMTGETLNLSGGRFMD